MPRIGGTADIESILRRIGETGVLQKPYSDDPGRLFLAIHDQWVANGGRVRGKRRNSIQHLTELLKAEGTYVSSLRSKLNGETRLKDGDAAALLGVYFSKWRFVAEKDGPGYQPLKFRDSRIAQNALVRALFGDRKSELLPKIEKGRRSSAKNVEIDPHHSVGFLAGRDVIPENFRSSKTTITISRVGSVAGPATATAIRGFCTIIDDLWRIALEDEIERVLIWIVDPGDRNISNDDSLAALANAEQLATFFRAVRLQSDVDAEERWRWLSNHAVVLVGSMEANITSRLYASDLSQLTEEWWKQDVPRRGIKHNHFLLDAYPPNWLRSLQFAQLYGDDLEDLEQGSFLLWLDEAETRWRYFGYAQATSPMMARDHTQSYTKLLELDSPGPIYDRAASIVHAAACFRLRLHSIDVDEDDLLQSMIILKNLEFAVFRLSEFLDAEKLSRLPP